MRRYFESSVVSNWIVPGVLTYYLAAHAGRRHDPNWQGVLSFRHVLLRCSVQGGRLGRWL